MRRVSICLFFFLFGCQNHRLQVRELVAPVYPHDAQVSNIGGTVTVTVIIGVDGRVVEAHGSGAHPMLVEAAEKNARQWVFGPFPPVDQFPIYHNITYVYRLEGPPAYVRLLPVTKTHLPDRIELVTRPFQSDYPAPTGPGGSPGKEQKK